jgi:hypothetical protein
MTGSDGVSPEVGHVIEYASDLALVAGDLTLGPKVTGVDILLLREAAASVAQVAETLTTLAGAAAGQLALESAHLRFDNFPGKEFTERFADPCWRPRDIIPSDLGEVRTITIEDDFVLGAADEHTFSRFDPNKPEDLVMIDMFNVLAALRVSGASGRAMQARAQYWPVRPKALGTVRDRLASRVAHVADGKVLHVTRVGGAGNQRWSFDQNLRIIDTRPAAT